MDNYYTSPVTDGFIQKKVHACGIARANRKYPKVLIVTKNIDTEYYDFCSLMIHS